MVLLVTNLHVHLTLTHAFIYLFLLLILGFGLKRLTQPKSKAILILSTLFYALLLTLGIGGKVESLLVCFPLMIIPILTALYLQHEGLLNRIVLSCVVLIAVYVFIPNYFVLSFSFISYYLEIMAIFYPSSEDYTTTNTPWMNVDDKNKNTDNNSL